MFWTLNILNLVTFQISNVLLFIEKQIFFGECSVCFCLLFNIWDQLTIHLWPLVMFCLAEWEPWEYEVVWFQENVFFLHSHFLTLYVFNIRTYVECSLNEGNNSIIKLFYIPNLKVYLWCCCCFRYWLHISHTIELWWTNLSNRRNF